MALRHRPGRHGPRPKGATVARPSHYFEAAGSARDLEDSGCALAVGARREAPREVEQPVRAPLRFDSTGGAPPPPGTLAPERAGRGEIRADGRPVSRAPRPERRQFRTARAGDERRFARQRVRRIGRRRRRLRAREPCRCAGSGAAAPPCGRRRATAMTAFGRPLARTMSRGAASGLQAACPRPTACETVLGSTPRPHAGRERHREHQAGHAGDHAGDQPLPQRRSSRNVADDRRQSGDVIGTGRPRTRTARSRRSAAAWPRRI